MNAVDPQYVTGEIEGLSNADYHQLEHYSRSDVVMALRSPAHLEASRKAPSRVTPAMRVGSAVHSLVLTPDIYGDEYVTQPEGINRRTKAGREEYDAWSEENAGKTILEAPEAELARNVARAVLASPAAKLLRDDEGKRETSYLWVDKRTGLPMKCRPDLWIPGRKLVVDLKTARDARPDAFGKAVFEHRYDVQAALYLDGVNATMGEGTVEHFAFLAVEKEPPYGVLVGTLDSEDLERGRDSYMRGQNRIAWCKEHQRWPGYASKFHRLTMPGWARKRIDEGNA